MKGINPLNKNRIGKLTKLMSDHEWDAMVLYGHSWRKEFFRCLLNVNFSGPHSAVVLLPSGEISVVVSNPWDRESVAAVLDADVLLAADFEKGLRKRFSGSRGMAVAVAGMELMETRFVEGIHQATSKSPLSASLAVEELRRVKTPDEIELLQQACVLADRGYQYFTEVIEAGMKEYELVAEVESFVKSNGAEDNFMLIASGGTEVVGMKPPTDRKFKKGDSVTTELSPQVGGYYAQICRTLVIGEPNAGQTESFRIFSEAQNAGQDFLRPGVDIADVARVQNDVFRKYGYGDYTGSKYTRVRGHGLGLYLDESPHVLEDVNYVVKEGMVLIVHPNTYLPLSGYMVFGDTLLVTAQGCVALNTTPRKLFEKEG
ncbi:MAG: Xaa-Pro peptidase family protein [Candidatus Acidiferrales bacterium]